MTYEENLASTIVAGIRFAVEPLRMRIAHLEAELRRRGWQRPADEQRELDESRAAAERRAKEAADEVAAWRATKARPADSAAVLKAAAQRAGLR